VDAASQAIRMCYIENNFDWQLVFLGLATNIKPPFATLQNVSPERIIHGGKYYHPVLFPFFKTLDIQ
jgi:hypothetical protein